MNGLLTQRLENLSPAKRILLEMKLKGGKPVNAAVKSANTIAPVAVEDYSIPRRKNSDNAGPLSFNQESLLFVERLNPNTSAYNLCEAVRFGGELNLDALQKTLDAIVSRHEALRTTFGEIENQPCQIINSPQPVHIEIFDLSDSENRQDQASKILDDEANRPMNLQTGEALFQANLIRLSDNENFFLVKMHHIISDGWSMSVFWKDFSQFYRAFARNTKPTLSELPIQFGDYAAWSREQLLQDEKRQTDFWKNELCDAPALLELPTDRPRAAVQSFRGAQQVEIFPQRLHDDLRRLSQRENATLFMTLLAAFNVLLTRYTGQKDLIVGTPVAGRNRTETENLIGFFVNALALRLDVSANPAFQQLLRQVKEKTLEAFSNQELPFEKVVAAVKPERSLSYNPIFQTVFALQPNSENSLNVPGLEIQPIKTGSLTSKFDLFLSAKETRDGLAITVEYSADLFDVATIKRLIGHYRNLLEAIVVSPNLRISELPMMNKAELDQILLEWNDTTSIYPQQPIQQLFENQAAARPDEIAVVSADKNLTYAELNREANKIANFLRKRGVKPNEPVGIFMDRSALMTAGMLGILKAGAAYMPLDVSYPQSRLQFMLDNSEAKIVLTVADRSQLLPETKATMICLDSDWKIIDTESDANPTNLNQSGDTAYVIYTSGSTGQPKGTLIPHRAVNRLVFNTNYVDFNSADIVAHVSNVSFDAATFELWGALLHGGRLVVLNKDLILSPETFISEIKRQKISKMVLTTSLFILLARDYPNAFETLETLVVGGEALDPTVTRLVMENNPPKRLVNGYGPTETTTFAVCHEIKSVAKDAQSIPIGRPIGNTQIYILDEFLNPVPTGIQGEIFIGGDGLSKGYLNRPELTAEKFIEIYESDLRSKNGFSSGEKSNKIRLYRTGDIARFAADGTIEYIGRKDGQIKLRGFRIELGEIETLINTHPAIKESVVAVSESGGEKKIIAYYAPEKELSVNALRDFLKQKLPAYMLPAVFVETENFARTPNGKIDRKKLPAFKETSIEIKTDETITDELELKLKLIWQNILEIKSIGVSDNFFDLGGHSLKAVRMFVEIEKALGCRLPLATLFQAPTIKQLAEFIRSEAAWNSSWNSLVPLRSNGTKTPFFCIHAVGGNVLEYNDLANHVSDDQPFYALQARGVDGKSAPLTNIEEMAAEYLKEIKQIQPEGPYYLGGRSFGGTAAYEMARQLLENGERVALLAIFDSYPKGWHKLCSEDEAENYRTHFRQLRNKRHLANLKQLSLFEKTKYVVEKLNYKSRKYKNMLWLAAQKFGLKKEDSLGAAIRRVEEINYSAVRNYAPQTYAGTITFFSAAEEVCPEENLTGWQKLAQGGTVEVVEVPGDHQTMIKMPCVGKLAQALEESIKTATEKF